MVLPDLLAIAHECGAPSSGDAPRGSDFDPTRTTPGWASVLDSDRDGSSKKVAPGATATAGDRGPAGR
jgi:hypothetical protein